MQTHSSTLLIIAINIIVVGTLLGSLVWVAASLLRERKKSIQHSIIEKNHLDQMAAQELTIDRLRHERSALFTENRELSSRISALEATLTQSEKKIVEANDLFQSTRKQMEKDFQILADKIFTQKSRYMLENHQDGLNNLLQPVKEQLNQFRKKVEDVYSQETKERIGLVKEIEHLKKLNLQISEDAVNLTSALKGKSKVQGLWGEMILERLLEDSGLKKGYEYESQVSMKDKNGCFRIPDVLVRLPEDRVIIIDAKVSLKAFEQACREKSIETEQRYLQQHLDSLRKHIGGLSDKQYHLLDNIRSPDFVILFVPTEGAFQAAVMHDPALLSTAMQKKIILASPATLMAILKIIHHMWRQDEQNRNSLAIAKQAGNLYDKFMGFLESFEEIGTRLGQSRDAWEVARKRLSTGRGNLVGRAETLRKLGIQNSKELPDGFRAAGEEPGGNKDDIQGKNL